jgi:hypothetical protein
MQDRATLQVQLEQVRLNGDLSESDQRADLAAARAELAALRDRLMLQEQTSDIQSRQLVALSHMVDARSEIADDTQSEISHAVTLERSATLGVCLPLASTPSKGPGKTSNLTRRCQKYSCVDQQ